MRIECTLQVYRPIRQVFDYVSDFTTSPRWDPVTLRSEILTGDGTEGTIYRTRMNLFSRTVRVHHVVVEHVPDNRLRIRGHGRGVRVQDTFTFRTIERGTELTAVRELELVGSARLLRPLLGPALALAGGRGDHGLRACLEPLPLAA